MRLVAIAAAAFAGFTAMGLLLGVPVELPARRPRRRDTRMQRRRRWLRQAGATVTPAQFYTVSAALGLAAFTGVWAATGPALAVRGRTPRRCRQPLSGSVQVGHSASGGSADASGELANGRGARGVSVVVQRCRGQAP